ncbi:MAG: aminotransferase class I/II-fold pyridoxal phosphate-dependent enzyme [Flavobacteriales bacterium]|nr:aminotransferase class I/II-fold pyridoxal phosphate-dependent enzyme [Flavobacteriales bacterium]MCB9197819.1 aminotransferase class I/II-fold pyridoxal phosphate-dependent enzyme [Flavobacteriales bacterium]
MIKYPHTISSKLPEVGTTIFTKMSALANQYGAINLSQGFPDFPIDERLIDLVHQRMLDGFNQYAPMQGALALREVISTKLKDSYGVEYCPNEEITVTAGATEAIYSAIAAFVKEDDEVVVFTPAYDCYVPAIKVHGGNPVYIQMHAPDYRIDWDHVKKLVNVRTRMILINTPHNPTGSILQKEDLLELEKIVAGKEIVVISDEVYEHIIYDGQLHESACKFPELRKQTLSVFSFGKTFHVTGWKLGYIVGPEKLMSEFRKVHQFNVFSCNHPFQLAIADYMQDAQTYGGVSEFYEHKRNKFLQAIEGSRFKPLTSSGTYFQLLSFEGITHEGDVEFAERMTKEYGLASIPVSVFYNSKLDEKVLRFCFAKQDETLERAGEILKRI